MAETAEGIVAGCWDPFSSAVVGGDSGLDRLYITLEVGGLRLYITWDLLTLFCRDMIT
jgi:hypothetical protein